MKKVLLTTIIFISSFFLFNLNVSATTVSYTLSEENFSKINDTFPDVRKKVLDLCGDTKKYIIYYDNPKYRVLVADNDSSYSVKMGSNLGNEWWFTVKNFDLYIYENGILTFNSSITTDTYINILRKTIVPNYRFLDTNIDNITRDPLNYYYVKYNGVSYSLPTISSSLYNIYVENFGPLEPEDPYEEEKNVLLNFYSCIIEKISYFANEVATNYIFLTILGVFTLIYVIELFRRLLI